MSRRRLLKASVGVAAAPVLAACGQDAEPVRRLRFATGRREGRTTPSARPWRRRSRGAGAGWR
nr:twin-arginine translocation signal domain-containing protein [Streptomyces luteolifulvus]